MGAPRRNWSRWGWAGAVLALAALGARSSAIALAAPQPSANIRSLFVGIDKYQNSYPRSPRADPDFHDLRGAVNDARLMQATLRAYNVPIAAKVCDPSGNRSITLVDGCATRNNIIGALERLISVSKPGDLIVFYYAGHGSQHPAQGRAGADQVSGISSTVVPADAWRPPPDDGSNDILDVDFKHLIDEADRVGVSVVTIFDSCHSGTATRGLDSLNGLTRAAPSDLWRARPALTWSAPQPSAPGSVRRYRVHMAAAGDNEVAHEWPVEIGRGKDGKPILEPHGAFTKALADTLAALKGATYLDIAQETRWRMSQEGRPQQVGLAVEGFCGANEVCENAGGASQHTQEEGELAAPFLGAAPDPAHGYPASGRVGETIVRINAGTVSGVTSGSTFQVWASQRLAETSKDAFLAAGTVSDAAYDTATLGLDTALKAPASLGQNEIRDPDGGLLLWIQERTHAYGADRLPLAIVSDNGDDAARLTGAIGGLVGAASVFQIATPASAAYFLTIGCGQVAFQTRTQAAAHPAGDAAACPTEAARAARTRPADDPFNPTAIWRGALADPSFTGDLTAAARTVANFNALLGLRRDHTQGWGCVSILQGDEDDDPCQNGVARPRFVVKKGPADFWLLNTSQGPLYRYALFLDADTYGVSVIDPPPNAKDPPLAAGQRIDFFSGEYQRGGHGVVMVLLTTDPINVAALRQEPVRGADGAPKNELERLLLNAAAGVRGDASAKLPGDYDAVAVDVTAIDGATGGALAETAPTHSPSVAPADARPLARTAADDEDRDGGRIVGGADASLGDAPYQVELAWREDSRLPEWAVKTVQHPWPKTAVDDHHCGGALIARDWVLTAQHCVTGDGGKPIAAGDLVVRGGSVSITVDGARALNPKMRIFAIRPDGIILHPGYAPSTDYRPPVNDLALIHLKAAVPLDPPGRERKRFATIFLAAHPYRAGPVVVTGWGSMKANTGAGQLQREQAQARMNTEAFVPAKDFLAATVRMAPNLQIATLKVVGNAACARQVLSQIHITRQGAATQQAPTEPGAVMADLSDDYLCAGDDSWRPSEKHRSTCQGDSGGPLAAPNRVGFEPALVAVVGWAVGCAQAPGVYTRVTPEVVNWVRSATGIPLARLTGSAR
jgi:hypothetical protein